MDNICLWSNVVLRRLLIFLTGWWWWLIQSDDRSGGSGGRCEDVDPCQRSVLRALADRQVWLMIHSPLTATTDITEWQLPDSLTVQLTDVFCTTPSQYTITVHLYTGLYTAASCQGEVLTAVIDSWHNRSWQDPQCLDYHHVGHWIGRGRGGWAVTRAVWGRIWRRRRGRFVLGEDRELSRGAVERGEHRMYWVLLVVR